MLELNGVQPGKGTRNDFHGVCPFMVPGSAQGGTSRFSPRLVYQTHNVTPALRPGANAVGLLSGHVFTRTPSIVMLLRVVFRGGGQRLVSTRVGGSWQSGPSYIDDTTFQASVDWAQRGANIGWSLPGFVPAKPADWHPGAAPDPATSNTPPLASQIIIDAIMMPPSTVVATHAPSVVALVTETAGTARPSQLRLGPSMLLLPQQQFLYTFPQNFVGTVRLAPLPHAETGSARDAVEL